jgi:hypothetical protein
VRLQTMKRLCALCLLSTVLAASCSSTRTASEPKPTAKAVAPPSEPVPIPIQSAGELGDQGQAPPTSRFPGQLLSQVAISTSSFNPTARQNVSILYVLSDKAKADICIYDPDFTLVRTLDGGSQAAGSHRVAWDGKDQDGVTVPDEAYFFTIRAETSGGVKDTYDPTQFSGGTGEDLTKADIDPISRAITYRLPAAARALIRIGVQDGPLFNTLVDWKPRVAGEITEHWDGRDQDDHLDLFGHPRFTMLITYFTLPENSVITYGNRSTDYRAYKAAMRKDRVAKDRPTRTDVRVSPHYSLPRTVDYSPNLSMTFAGAKKDGSTGLPILTGKALVKVDIDEEDKTFFVNQQYEITFFLDGEFYTEQEVGYAPFNWVWDLTDVPAGEHLLTVNLSGFKDQIGVLSRRLVVAKQ